MKSFLLAAAATLAILAAGAPTAHAQDRGSRGPQQSGYGNYNNNNNDRWGDDDDRRYQGYDRGSWRYDNRGYYANGPRRMSPAEYQRWRRYQQYRGAGNGRRQNWAYQQGVRDGRRQGNRGCGNGNGRW